MAHAGYDFRFRQRKLLPAMTAPLQNPRKKNSGNSGLTLVEVAVALMIIGVLTVAAMHAYDRSQQQKRIQKTLDNMDTIIQAVSTFAETAGRVPCPGNPGANDITFGWERGVTAADLQVSTGRFPVGTCTQADREGIVPFYSLGLSPELARDGWGNYFTYAVSPVFSRNNDQAGAVGDTGDIHGRCRHTGWVNRFDNYNRNAIKARFCCADQLGTAYDNDTDLVIRFDVGGGQILSPQRISGTSLNYDNMSTPTTGDAGGDIYPTIDTSAIEAPAIILVSHGQNGLGAYLGNNTAARTAPASAAETQNADGDGIFVDLPVISMSAGANYYDDIVRWMTQDGILAAHGAISCQYP
jgi:prepilin-type N-terminal cleavage/methylation domain-containing protein